MSLYLFIGSFCLFDLSYFFVVVFFGGCLFFGSSSILESSSFFVVFIFGVVFFVLPVNPSDTLLTVIFDLCVWEQLFACLVFVLKLTDQPIDPNTKFKMVCDRTIPIFFTNIYVILIFTMVTMIV